MSLIKQARARKGSRAAGLAVVLGLVAGLVAQAVPSSAATAAPRLSAHAPGGRTVAFRKTIVIPAGSRHVAGSARGVAYAITRAKVSPQTSPCTLTVYDPYWFAESNADNFVQASAVLACDERVTTISVTPALYSGVSPYPLLGYATSTVDNTSEVFGEYNYQVYEFGYYISGAIGSAGSPLNYSAPEQYSSDTYISWLT